MKSVEQAIFRAGSTTYYWGAKLFPKTVRSDVLKLYSFLRVADDYVDCQPAKDHEFDALRKAWDRADHNPDFDTTPQHTDTTDERVVKNLIAVSRRYSFKREWLVSFWDSMQADLDGKIYRTLDDSLWYVYGSAGAVGLMMMAIMQLPPQSHKTAALQGQALQWINFVRDLAEDNELGRCYFPAEDLKKFGLNDLQEATARQHPGAFMQFMQFQIDRYQEWQHQANAGLRYIPGMLRPGLKTAIDMYGWTAGQIAADPFIVFRQKVKPSKRRLVACGLRNLARS